MAEMMGTTVSSSDDLHCIILLPLSRTHMQAEEVAVPRAKVALLICTAVSKGSLVVMALLELR